MCSTGWEDAGAMERHRSRSTHFTLGAAFTLWACTPESKQTTDQASTGTADASSTGDGVQDTSSVTTGIEPTTGGAPTSCGAFSADQVKETPKFGASIADDTALAEFAGARCLTGGGLRISGVRSLAPLASLELIEGDMTIAGNLQLTTVAPLASLTSIQGTLYITKNPVLTSLSGLASLVSLGGELQIGERGTNTEPGEIPARGNDMLQDLAGLEGLQATAGITIGDNGALASLAGIDHLMQGTTTLVEIANNPLLPTAAAQAFADKVDDDGEGILVCGNLDGEPCSWIIGD